MIRALLRVSSMVAVALAALGCGDDGPEGQTKEMMVEHFRAPCEGEGPRMCLVADRFDGQGPSMFYSTIQGFDWYWGSRFQLAVLVTEVTDAPADGSSWTYEFEAIRSEEIMPEGTEFTVTAQGHHLTGDATSGYRFIEPDARDIDCSVWSLCGDLETGLAAGPVTMTLSHPATIAEPLKLESIE